MASWWSDAQLWIDHLISRRPDDMTYNKTKQNDIDGLAQDCSISIADALEILQSCTEPSVCNVYTLLVIL